MSWPTVELQEVSRTGSGTTPSRKKTEFYSGNIPWVKSGELRETEIMDTEEHVSEEAVKSTSLKIVPPGSLLVAMYGATVGRVGLLGVEATTNQAVCHVIPDPEKADNRYLFHLLQERAQELIGRGVGGAQPNINQGTIKQLQIPLPPLEEQKRIAAILDQADALRRLRQRAINRLNTLGQAIFHEMFGEFPREGELGGLPELKEFLTDVKNGMTRRAKGSDEQIDVVLRLKDVRDLEIDYSDVARISLSDAEKQKFSIEKGDLLFVRVNGNPEYVGRNAVFDGFEEPVYFNDHIMRVRVSAARINPRFLSFVLNSPFGKRQIAKNRKTSAGQHTINQDGLSKIRLQVPNLEDQERFVEALCSLDVESGKERYSAQKLDKLFASLQNRAFRGEL